MADWPDVGHCTHTPSPLTSQTRPAFALLPEVYLSSDHEVTTTAGSNAKAGRVWDVNGDGVWVQCPTSGQSAT